MEDDAITFALWMIFIMALGHITYPIIHWLCS
jgi:hypothetical protein